MTEMPDCAAVRELIPELAAGVAYGDERAHALEHLARCPHCRNDLDATSRTVDDLLLLAPEHEPPAGFEASVMARLEPARRRSRRMLRTVALQAAAMVAAVAVTAGAIWWHTADDRQLAENYRKTLAVANGRYLTAAPLRQAGVEAGHVFGYQGSPSWVFLTLQHGGPSGAYRATLVVDDGRSLDLGGFSVVNGQASWGTTVPVPISKIRLVQLFGPQGLAAAAEFR